MFSRKWWKRILIGVAVTLVLSVIGTYLEWTTVRSRGEKLRDEAVARLDQEDPNWRSVDLTTARNAKLPPPDRNGGELAVAAFALLPQSYREWTRDEKWRGELKPGVLPHEEDICELDAAMCECGEALTLARSIRDLPHGGLPLVFAEPNPNGTLLPNTQNMREVASLLDCDVTTHAYHNRPNEAIRSTHALLNLGPGAIGDEPTLISQLVRLAITSIAVSASQRTLGLGEPTVGLAELQTAYANELTAPRITHGMRGERAMMYRLIQNFDDGLAPLSSLTCGPAGIQDRLATPFLKKYIPAQQAKMLEMCDAFIAADKLSGPERKAALDAIKLPPKGLDTLLIQLLMPALEKVCHAETRIQAQLATAVAGLACERYRQKFGKWPETLAAIPKDILSTLPTDPYTGTALRYAKFDDGVAVYSTGEDLIDHKGVEFTPHGKAGTDLGFRLFNPDQRRREPPPKEAEPTDPIEPLPPVTPLPVAPPPAGPPHDER